MLAQAFHRRPMLLGNPSRYPRRSLWPAERVPFFRALTHPDELAALRAGEGMEGRLAGLAATGRSAARGLEVRFFVLHTRDRRFPPEQIEAARDLLERAFGGPALRDDASGDLLWVAYGEAPAP
jgi:hypothetical protein